MTSIRPIALCAMAMLAPATTHARGPMYASFGFGPFIEISDSRTLFTIKPEVGRHLASFPQLALDVPLHLAFGDFTYVAIAPGAHYDIWVPGVPRFYVAPGGGLGFGMASANEKTKAGFVLRFGATLKYYVSDPFAIGFQVFAMNFLIGASDAGTPINYDMLFSAIYHF